jgi:hypothetical protein
MEMPRMHLLVRGIFLFIAVQYSFQTSAWAQLANNFRYEKCTPNKNDYFEQDLRQLNGDVPFVSEGACVLEQQGVLKDATFFKVFAGPYNGAFEYPPQCVYDSLMAGPTATPAGVKYARCKAGGQGIFDVRSGCEVKMCPRVKSLRDHKTLVKADSRCRDENCMVPKPCVSESYSAYVYNSYVMSMQCLNLDPREMFPIINHESHFHLNAESYARTAFGAGQLQLNSAVEVNKFFDRHTEGAQCSPVRDLLNRKFSGEQNACELVSLPENPARNFLYSGILYKHYKARAAKEIEKAKLILSEEDTNFASAELGGYIYNGGAGVAVPAFKAFVTEHGHRFRSSKDFRDTLFKFLGKYAGSSRAGVGPKLVREKTVAHQGDRPARRKKQPSKFAKVENAAYMKAVVKDNKRVGGEQCSLED